MLCRIICEMFGLALIVPSQFHWMRLQGKPPRLGIGIVRSSRVRYCRAQFGPMDEFVKPGIKVWANFMKSTNWE